MLTWTMYVMVNFNFLIEINLLKNINATAKPQIWTNISYVQVMYII